MLPAGHRIATSLPSAASPINLRAMIPFVIVPMFAAAGYSLLYLLGGGGFGVALLIFVIAKMLGK